ncbi:MAG: TVP38/TMEM64 family protein [Gammaproteobacteria bacterium]|nr:TVP38/TMEM64 family protein [Gammaproteobacteria bacterium]
MKQTALQHPVARPQSPLWGIAASILFVATLLALLVWLGVHEQVLQLLQWFEAQGAWAPVLFILLMATVVLLVLPGVLLTTGAGFVFGVVEGSLYVIAGTTLGATLAFLIARHLFGPRAREFTMAHTRLRLVSDELTPEGWKIVLLTRLIPFFPSKISNYFFGLTSFSLRGYLGGSLLGFIPFSVHSVYLGSLAADITTLGARHTERSALEWGLYGAGFVATVIAVIYLNRLAHRALDRYHEEGAIEEDLP